MMNHHCQPSTITPIDHYYQSPIPNQPFAHIHSYIPILLTSITNFESLSFSTMIAKDQETINIHHHYYDSSQLPSLTALKTNRTHINNVVSNIQIHEISPYFPPSIAMMGHDSASTSSTSSSTPSLSAARGAHCSHRCGRRCQSAGSAGTCPRRLAVGWCAGRTCFMVVVLRFTTWWYDFIVELLICVYFVDSFIFVIRLCWYLVENGLQFIAEWLVVRRLIVVRDSLELANDWWMFYDSMVWCANAHYGWLVKVITRDPLRVNRFRT